MYLLEDNKLTGLQCMGEGSPCSRSLLTWIFLLN